MDAKKPEVVVIAGVGPGLGASIARRFAAEKCRIGLLARSTGYLQSLAKELQMTKTEAISTDLAVPDQVRSALDRIAANLGSVDVLINHASAGGPFAQEVVTLGIDVFEQSWRVGVLGGLVCSQSVLPSMLQRERGVIIFTGATSSVRGSSIAFSSAKFAVRGLAQAMAKQLWPKGIHVAHVVIDGVIGTDREPFITPAEPLMKPSAIAEAYWQLAIQDPSAWTLELDLRPNREAFFE